jgi:hypothetical protein
MINNQFKFKLASIFYLFNQIQIYNHLILYEYIIFDL